LELAPYVAFIFHTLDPPIFTLFPYTTLFRSAIPNFFFGLVAIYLLSINLGWFPAQGTVSNADVSGLSEVLDRIHHMVLPGITLGLAGTVSYMRYMRSEVLDVIGSD